MEPNKSELLPVLLAQYAALKAEQTARITIRENALTGNLVAVAAIVSVALARTPAEMLILLAIPIASSSFFWVYLNNDLFVNRIRYFLAEEFATQLADVLAASNSRSSTEFFALWEQSHRVDSSRRLRKQTNSFTLLIGFVGTSALALVISYSAAIRTGGWVKVVWIVDVALLAVVCLALIATADWDS